VSGGVDYAIPPGWCWTSVEELTSYVQRGKSPKYAEQSGLPVVNQKCVRWDGVEAEHLKFVDPSQWDAWAPERTLRDGDILWNSTGTGTIGRAAIYRPIDGYRRVVADSHVTILRLRIGLPEYLHAWIRSPLTQGRIEEMQSGSTNQVELGRTEVLRTRVPTAPLNEQRRIVAKLEALQARSRRAREALDAVPPLLDKLRQSILAAAFRGDLTKNWRAKHKDVEPASELLKRIRAERRKKWEEAELAKIKAKGKTPTDDKWKTKYKEPEPVEAAGLAELPKGWCWASAEELVRAPITYGVVQPGPETPGGVPFVRAMDMEEDTILLDQVRCISRKVAEGYPRTCLEVGDVLLGIVRAAKVAVVPQELVGGNIVRGIARLAPQPGVAPGYLAGVFASPEAQAKLLAKHRGIDMPVINIADVRMLPVPLAPTPEQKAIAQRIQMLRARVRDLMAICRQLSSQSDALEAACLASAFWGNLVPQDPNDEPAEVMLARLRAASESAADGSEPKRGKRGRSRRNGARAEE
jgi:type I restriction enzyme, S subunit